MTFPIYLISSALSLMAPVEQKAAPTPNIIFIYCDDLGYGDLSAYGSIWNKTPELDKMATEGIRFTDFYAGAPVCTPSRTGLLTGSYARRVDMDRDAKGRWVLFPVAKKGINPAETLLPEALKTSNYATAMIGKWHLGDQPEFNPTRHGFDYWYGIPYSNDMEVVNRGDPPLPLMENEKVIEQYGAHKEFDQSTLTQKYTEKAIEWIDANKKKPFFLYLAHTMPHNPVAARPDFYENTNNPKKGFGACVAEISWSTGEILDYLRKENLDKNTLVVFTSDNGGNPRWGASNGILRGQKGQTYEGGVRVPFIAWYPGKIKPGGVCNHPASVIDMFETLTTLAGAKVRDNVVRDGKDITDYLFDPDKEQPPRPFYYWHFGSLEAVRYGNWKLQLAGKFSRVSRDGPELYDLQADPGETINVAGDNREMVELITDFADKHKQSLGERENAGPEVRKTILVEDPKPVLK